MKILITAGSTLTNIDLVRGITNIFKGRTGAEIARWFSRDSTGEHFVTLLTSRPELYKYEPTSKYNLEIISFTTFNDLESKMRDLIVGRGDFDLVIHSAAVSDYKVAEVLEEIDDGKLVRIPADAKIPSGKILFCKLIPTEKIVDKIKRDWGFKGTLIMFKLQVDMTRSSLIKVARASMERAGADMVIANCLEWAQTEAYVIGPSGHKLKKVSRHDIASEIEKRIK